MKIFVAGHKGLVGSALVRELTNSGYTQIITRDRAELDLLDLQQVQTFFATEKPDWVFLAAAKVGGIHANSTYPVDFLLENLKIQNNIIESSYQNKVQKLLFLGSSCIYPKLAEQPIKEASLLTGPLEPTNEPYAVAKIAGIKLCSAYNQQYGTNFISVMPTNLYGPNDNYHAENSHVLPALIRRFHEAKESRAPEVTLWGTGSPKREFLYSDDLARACVYLMKNKSAQDVGEIINIGTGVDCTISELAEIVKSVVGYTGKLMFNNNELQNGTPRKLMDSSRIHALGWKHSVELKTGITLAYADFLKNKETRK